MKTDKRELLEEFFATMTKIRRIVEKAVNLSCEDKTATILQVQALAYLNEHASSTVSELAQALQMSSSAIAQFTDRLADANLVTREPDVSDRRIVRLMLTEKGKKESAEVRKKMFEKMSKVFDYISEDNLKELLRIHNKILYSLEDQIK